MCPSLLTCLLKSQLWSDTWTVRKHLDSQKADHYSGSEGEDSGNIIVVAETVMVVDGSGYGVVAADTGIL